MDKLIERIAIFVPLMVVAGIIIWLGSQFISVNKIGSKTNQAQEESLEQPQQKQAVVTKNPLSANELAKQLDGSWSYLTEAVENPDGTVDQGEHHFIFSHNPTKFDHGPFRIEFNKAGAIQRQKTYSGEWHIIPADGGKYQPTATGKYNFKLFLSFQEGNEITMKLVDYTPRDVLDFDGKTMSMTAGYPPKVHKFRFEGR